jgi:hypothetical protein
MKRKEKTRTAFDEKAYHQAKDRGTYVDIVQAQVNVARLEPRARQHGVVRVRAQSNQTYNRHHIVNDDLTKRVRYTHKHKHSSHDRDQY